MFLFQKQKIGPVSTITPMLPEFNSDGKVILKPVKILARRLVKQGESPTTQLLVQWAHLPEAEATWKYLEDIRHRFPELLS